MKVEYLSEGSPECPLIRLYDFDSVTVARLNTLIMRLADGVSDTVAVHEVPDIEPVDGCQLFLQAGTRSQGVTKLSSENAFQCTQTRLDWNNVAELVKPFCESGQLKGFQWLDDNGDISLLLSHDGHW